LGGAVGAALALAEALGAVTGVTVGSGLGPHARATARPSDATTATPEVTDALSRLTMPTPYQGSIPPAEPFVRRPDGKRAEIPFAKRDRLI